MGRSAIEEGSMTVAEPTAAPSVRGKSRRWLVIGAIVVIVLIAAVVGIVLATRGSDPKSQAAQQYDAAYSAFHTKLAQDMQSLNTHLGSPGTLVQATQDATHLGNDYQSYGAAVKAIAMPAAATADEAKVVQLTNAGLFLMTQASKMVTPGGAQAALNADLPQLTTQLTAAEKALRTDLGLGNA
jgi:hypothetical protein